VIVNKRADLCDVKKTSVRIVGVVFGSIEPSWFKLAQRRARGNAAHAQRTLKEGVVSKALIRIKDALAQAQQREQAFEDLAVSNA